LSNYVIWKYVSVPFAAVLKNMSGLEEVFRLQDGTPLQEGFPEDVAYHMHADFPDDLLLLDNMLNVKDLAVISSRLKQAIESRRIPEVEYLPLRIVDHKGRIASADYFIVHPLAPVDCIDREQSVFDEDLILPGSIDSFEKLVIDDSKIPEDRQIFKLEGFWDITLVRRDLAQALDAQKFSGLGWLEIEDYPEP